MLVRPLIVIPAFNNQNTIEEVTSSICNLYSTPVLIIDDGSDNPIENIIPKNASLTILRNKKNMGKGYSIRKAFNYAIENNFTHVITLDGDGQHKAKDIQSFFNMIKQKPFSMIIGKRKLDSENVPSSSKFGRSFSNFWVKYQTDEVISDSQSGFRSYPIFHIQKMSFFTTRYDFEIEVLVRLLWKKVEVIEIETDVYYPPPTERISHFDKLWDNIKISTLNTVLVILSLLRSNLSSNKKMISLALGVFWAVQPIYGFQIFILAIFSVTFRLNFTLMFASSQISIPPMIPIWTYISLLIGSKITGSPLLHSFEQINLSFAKESITSFILGSITLGLTLSGLVILVYLLLSTNKKRKKLKERKSWNGKMRGGLGNLIMDKVMKSSGQRPAYFLLIFICPYFYFFSRRSVQAQNEYFKYHSPNQGFIVRQISILKVFYTLGKSLIDTKLTKIRSMDDFKITRNGVENLKNDGRGHIIIGAHTGGWLLASKLFVGDSKNINSMKESNAKRINVIEFSAEKGHSSHENIKDDRINFIGSNDPQAIFKINKALDQGETCIFMADRVVSKEVEQLTFFGGQTFFDKTPFRIALIKNVPVSFAFAFKKSSTEYDLYISERNEYKLNDKLNKELKIISMMNLYLRELENKLEKYPYQWFNFFNFWSTIPTPIKDLGKKANDIKIQ